MSSAYHPQGMRSRFQPTKDYVSWKGVVQTGVVTGRMRPQTNKDYTNNVIYKHGLARPMKHYRKGRIMVTENTPSHLKRQVRSGVGRGSIADLMDRPGCVSFSNDPVLFNDSDQCYLCRGDIVVSSYFANPSFLSNNPPERVGQGPTTFCFNQPRKAKYRHTKYKTYMQGVIHIPPPPETSNDCTTCQPIVKRSNEHYYETGAVTSHLHTATIAHNSQCKDTCFPNEPIYETPRLKTECCIK